MAWQDTADLLADAILATFGRSDLITYTPRATGIAATITSNVHFAEDFRAGDDSDDRINFHLKRTGLAFTPKLRDTVTYKNDDYEVSSIQEDECTYMIRAEKTGRLVERAGDNRVRR